MFKVTSYIAPRIDSLSELKLESARNHPDVEDDIDAEMRELEGEGADEDEEGFGENKIASPGEAITSAAAFMRGHGTYVEDGQVIASVTGTVERVNKLVSVRALRSRYNPEVGDLIVARITEVGPRRWKVDANSRQDAVLMLSSINLPGGVQRRKLESDELQMRNFFQEGDLLVAEVQAFFADGAMSLHTRSLKYGKLRNGHLVCVPPTLVRRLKSHFHALPCGVDIILGLNGYIWISKHVETHMQEGEEGFDAEGVYSDVNEEIDAPTRTAIALVSNVITALARHSVPLTDSIIAEAYNAAVELELGVKDLLEDTEAGDRVVGMVVGHA
uniref:Uncharacterized protein n=1 Tax=Bartheletia paradoxa TaxID=669517 RepID=A0A2D0XKM3_9BASI|nr:hypothetical protein SPAR03687 [Bartheletia paradoxa]